ncbi:MAG: hypothetical protein RMY34_19180 [Aulosira sp. DedQUE10]|nr:hypothetical protein [Aulosira sp. DedQUE10]
MTVTNRHDLTPFLQNMGKTTEEQLRINQAAMQLLKKWLEEEVSEEDSIQRQKYCESFKQIVDNERLPGQKLYSQE